MSADEKRRFARQAVEVGALAVEARDGSGATYAGRTRDLSACGCFIETSEQPPIGSHVQVFICRDDAHETLRTVGRVVRSEPRVGFGIEFPHDTERARDRVAAFIRTLVRR